MNTEFKHAVDNAVWTASTYKGKNPNATAKDFQDTEAWVIKESNKAFQAANKPIPKY